MITGPSLPRLARPLDAESFLQIIAEARTFLRVLGVAAAISTSLSSGHAEIEEYDGHNKSLFTYAGSAFTSDLIITLASKNNNTVIVKPENQYELYTKLYDDGNFNASTITQRDSSSHFTHGDDISDNLIPSTVWGLEVRNGVHFDYNYNYLGMAADGANTEVLMDNTDVSVAYNLFQQIVDHFRGANCDVELFEHRSLKHCNVNDRMADINTRIANDNDNNGGSTTLNAEGAYYSGASNPIPTPVETIRGTPTSTQGLSEQINSIDTVHDLSTLVIDSINAFALQVKLADLSPTRDICHSDGDVVDGDVDFYLYASCQTGHLYGHGEFNIPYDFSEPIRISIPIVNRPLVASTVPELSTWIMLIIGFVIIAIVRWKNTLNVRR